MSQIDKAKVEDSLQIAQIIKEGWNAAYKGIISDEDLQNMDIEKISNNWKKSIQDNKNIYVYKENDEILGVIRFGKAEESESETTGEVEVLYVKPNQKRKGIGTQLLNFAKEELQKMGYDKIIIWCLKGNVQGANFYKKCGGQKIKERDYMIRGIKIREEGYFYNLDNKF